MSTETRDLIFYIVYPIKLLLGISVFITNLFIFVIFVRKQKREPSDWLILPNLLIDAFHGLGMCIPLYLLTPAIMVKGALFFQSFIFFSLTMLILMTVNRYIATVRPIKYPKWFAKRYIFLSFSAITFSTLALFSAVAYALFVKKIIEKSMIEFCEHYKTYEKSSYLVGYWWAPIYNDYGYIVDYGYEKVYDYLWHSTTKTSCHEKPISVEKAWISVHFFVLNIWPQFQLGLVLINVILMSFVYAKISKLFNVHVKFGFVGRFWSLIRQLFVEDVKMRAQTLQNRITTLLDIQETDFTEREMRKSVELLGNYDSSVMVICRY